MSNHRAFRMRAKRGKIAPFLFLAAILLGALPMHIRSAENAKKFLVYVGTYTNTASKGIYAYRFDAATGKAESLGLAAATAQPSFLAIAPNRRFLYAVNEMQDYGGERTGAVSAFAMNRATGKLRLLNELPSRGEDPAFLSLDGTGKYVLVANYTGGTLAVFPVLADGKLGRESAYIQHRGSGPNHERQDAAHPHMFVTSPDNRFALVTDLGLDEVFAYHFDAAKGTLANPSITKVELGIGPRHIAMSPDGRFIYLVSELEPKITVFSYRADDAKLTQLQSVSFIPQTHRKNGARKCRSAPRENFFMRRTAGRT